MPDFVKARIVLEDVNGDGCCEKNATSMSAAQEAAMLGGALMETLKDAGLDVEAALHLVVECVLSAYAEEEEEHE